MCWEDLTEGYLCCKCCLSRRRLDYVRINQTFILTFLQIKAVLALRMWVPIAVITNLWKVLSLYSLLLHLCLLQISFPLIIPPFTSWTHAPLCAWVITSVRHRWAERWLSDAEADGCCAPRPQSATVQNSINPRTCLRQDASIYCDLNLHLP